MSRRRRRHRDPAQLPRRDPAERQRREEHGKAQRELARLDDALARSIAVLLAAAIYFGTWAANAAFGLFPPPVGFDVTNPQFVVGAGALIGSIFLARLLMRTFPTRRLITLSTWATSGFGVLVALVTLLSASALPGLETFPLIAVAMAVSWLIAALWVALVSRRAVRLLTALHPE